MNVDYAIDQYIKGNHDIVQKIILEDVLIIEQLLKWIKSVNDYACVEIYKVEEYLKI